MTLWPRLVHGAREVLLAGDYGDAYTEWYPKSPAYRRTTSEIWFRVSWESSSGDPDYEFTSGYQVAIWTPDAAGRRRQLFVHID